MSPNDLTIYRQLLSDMANEAAADMPTLSNPFDALTPTGEAQTGEGPAVGDSPSVWQSLSFDLAKLLMGISPNTKSSFSTERERASTVFGALMGTTIAAGFAMAEEPEIPEFGWAPDELWGATSRELPAVHISDGNIRFYKGLQHGVTELNPAGASVSTSFKIAEQYASRSGEVKVWEIPAKEIAPLGLERGYTNLNGEIGDEIKLSPSAVEVFNRYKPTIIRIR